MRVKMQFLRCTGYMSSAQQHKWLAVMVPGNTDIEHFYRHCKFWLQLIQTTNVLLRTPPNKFHQRALPKYKTDHFICVLNVC